MCPLPYNEAMPAAVNYALSSKLFPHTMSTIPDRYKGLGYGTIYSDSELRQAIANAEVAGIVNNLSTTTTAIVTSGSGDKIIIASVEDKQIKIYSLFFVASGSAGIIFKSGDEAISGNMSLLSLAADFARPITISVNADFVIFVDTEVDLNGFVLWGSE